MSLVIARREAPKSKFLMICVKHTNNCIYINNVDIVSVLVTNNKYVVKLNSLTATILSDDSEINPSLETFEGI